MYVCMYACIYVWIVCMHVCMYACKNVRISVCICWKEANVDVQKDETNKKQVNPLSPLFRTEVVTNQRPFRTKQNGKEKKHRKPIHLHLNESNSVYSVLKSRYPQKKQKKFRVRACRICRTVANSEHGQGPCVHLTYLSRRDTTYMHTT